MNYYLYASHMWRARNCPGSVKATRREKTDDDSPGGSGTPEASYGRELHKLTEEVINGKVELGSIQEPERSYVGNCIQFLAGRELQGETETPLFVLVKGELIASCRADLLSVQGEMVDGELEQHEVVIPDWKFYRGKLETNEWQWQGITMCAAALQQYPDCTSAVALAYLPIHDITYDCRLSREQLDETVGQIYETYLQVNEETPELHPGPWCARCEHLSNCPAAKATITDLATQADLEAIWAPGQELAPVKTLDAHFYNEITKWSRGRFLGFVDLLPFLPSLLKGLQTRLKADIAKGHLHRHYKVTHPRKPRKGPVSELRAVLGDRFTSEEFDELCKPAWGDVKKALQAQGMSENRIDELLERFDQGTTDRLTRVP